MLWALPLILMILFSETNTVYRTFLESNDMQMPAEICTALNEDIIEQIVAAEKLGEYQVNVNVFVNGTGDNWPHTTYMGGRVATSLYKHGVTGTLMDVQIVPDPEVNKRFHIPEE